MASLLPGASVLQHRDRVPGPPPPIAEVAGGHDSAADLQRDVRRRPADRRGVRDRLSAASCSRSRCSTTRPTRRATSPSSRCGGRRRAASTSGYLHRADRTGYKAGALEAGLKVARGEFVAIFDADFVPPRRLPAPDGAVLRRAAKLALVQARWGHINQRLLAAHAVQAILLDGHFVLEHGGRNRIGLLLQFQRHGRRLAARQRSTTPAAGSTTR